MGFVAIRTLSFPEWLAVRVRVGRYSYVFFSSAEEECLHRQARCSVSLSDGSESIMYKFASLVSAAHAVILVNFWPIPSSSTSVEYQYACPLKFHMFRAR